jgi:hypothetical protein
MIAAALVLRNLDQPGIYYDEVFQVDAAVDFLAANPHPQPTPGMQNVWIFGRPFPVMTLSYLGALKSQALIPVFALFGASIETLRSTTLVWAFIGLLLMMFWARKIFGLQVAMLAGAFLALDPSFLFASRHDWGPVALALLLRCAGLYLITSGWLRGSTWRFLAAGLCFGLGVYNKIDFAIFVAAAGLALVLANPRGVIDLIRNRRASAIALALGFAIGAAWVLARIGLLLGTTATRIDQSFDKPEEYERKLNTFITMLDGSYFHRLMLTGGDFKAMAEVEGAASGTFLVVLGVATLALMVSVVRRGRRGNPDRGTRFVLLTLLLTLLGIYFAPRAARLHHALHVYPFPHLVVAIFVVRLWGAARGVGWPGPWASWRRPLLRAAALGVTAAVLVGSLHVTLKTLDTIAQTRGKGLWSNSLMRFAKELEVSPETVVVSLDWGFDKPLRLVAPQLRLIDPTWGMRERKRPKRVIEGTRDTVYLIHPPDKALFSFGSRFLKAVGKLPEEHVSYRRHTDRVGDATFISIRIHRPHQFIHGKSFKLRLD